MSEIMRTVQDDIGREDESAPIEMLASLFEARDWAFEYAGEDEISAEVKGAWATYQIQAIWRVEDRVLQLLCLPDIRIADSKRQAMFEALALINEQIWVGHFDTWSSSGVVL